MFFSWKTDLLELIYGKRPMKKGQNMNSDWTGLEFNYKAYFHPEQNAGNAWNLPICYFCAYGHQNMITKAWEWLGLNVSASLEIYFHKSSENPGSMSFYLLISRWYSMISIETSHPKHWIDTRAVCCMSFNIGMKGAKLGSTANTLIIQLWLSRSQK